jgi:hypothetical protein
MVAVNLKGDAMKALAIEAFYAALAAMKWQQDAMKIQVDDVHMRELRQFSKISAAPLGVFDPLYAGLTADAARLDIALARLNARR